MIEDRTYDKIMAIVTPDDFYDRRNGIIFNAIEKLNQSDQPYDLTMVASALSSEGTLGQVGGIDYLAELTHIIPNAANIGRYADIVKSKSKLRELSSTATKIHELVYEVDADITRDATSAIDESGQMIMELAKDGSHRDPWPLSKLMDVVYKELEELYTRDDEMTGVPTGFYDLDKLTNGLQPGNLVILAGRPAMGKTSFALNIAQNAATRGKTVAVFSLEMSSNQLVQRMISYEAEVQGQKLQNGSFSADDWQRLAAVGDNLAKMKIFIDDTSSIPVMEIRGKCRRLHANKDHGLDLIIIDYLQLMDNKRIDNREQQISDISRNLKGLAKELNLPVIALSQLNRSVEQRSEKRPMPSDLRESGAIEQDADLILFIYRDEVYHENTTDKGIAEIIVAKHRAGPTGTVRLAFQKEFTKFRNLDKAGLAYRGN
jgi:replicative DNA helicase